jgi:hypothetical protein
MNHLYEQIVDVMGVVMEFGTRWGPNLGEFSALRGIYEPFNRHRKIIGFDTFAGFPSLAKADKNKNTKTRLGDLKANSYDELQSLIEIYDQDRFLGHIPKVHLIKGDIAKTAPIFVKQNPHLLVSLLFIDCDLYKPTKAALKSFLPRMKRGSVLAFDELDNPQWPGETTAMLEALVKRPIKLQRFEWDPYISFAVL